MTPSQADAIAQAILQPDNKREAVQQRRREHRSRWTVARPRHV
ncbi:MAG: hypothetical protein ABS955_13755 [Stenotrophomonas maltophilia]